MSYSIVEYGGSTGNGAKENQAAIQSAVKAAFSDGGGIVYVPPGIYKTGNICLMDNVTLYVESGAVLLGSQDFNDYQLTNVEWPWADMLGIPIMADVACQTGFIYAINARNIGIDGHGTIDGNGMGHLCFPSEADPQRRRPHLLFFDKCVDVFVNNVTLKNPAMYTYLGSRSKRLSVDHVKTFSVNTENGDGLDFNGCSDVTISNCFIESGDDAISLKTTYPEWACRNYTITNCTMRAIWAGFRMGTESSGDMSEIALNNCVFVDCNDGLKIQDCSTGVYENISISNIVMRNVHRPVFMTASSFRLSKFDSSVRPGLGGIKNVNIDDMVVYMHPESKEYRRNCFVISGRREQPIENINISNASIVFAGQSSEDAVGRVDAQEYLDYSFIYAEVVSLSGDFPASGIFMRHINEIVLSNCSFKRYDNDKRPMILGYDINNAFFDKVRAQNHGSFIKAADADIKMINCCHNGRPIDTSEAFSEEEADRYQSFKELTRVTDIVMDEMAARVDEAQGLPDRKIYPQDIWQKQPDRWCADIEISAAKAYLLFIGYGDVRLKVNGAEAGCCRFDKLYRSITAWAANITAYIKNGAAHIELIWEDPEDKGGPECVLPFGEFKALPVGLCAPMRVYSKK